MIDTSIRHRHIPTIPSFVGKLVIRLMAAIATRIADTCLSAVQHLLPLTPIVSTIAAISSTSQ